jgi:apolipoprotein N-acyltransferase
MALSPARKDKIRRRAAWALSGLSGLLYFLSFPPVGANSAAWICLLPWVVALRLYPAASARLSYLAGLCAWIPGLWFLSPVTIPGALVLAAYCALFFVPAGLAWSGLLSRWTPQKPMLALRFVLGGAAFWCALESLRGWLFTGFPWNGLGVSQWENYALIQIASLGGVEAVSFIVAALNLGIAVSLISVFESVGTGGRRRMHPELYLPILMLSVAFTWGARELRRQMRVEREVFRVGVVQPLADNKWSQEQADENYRVLGDSTELLRLQTPDLILWPETALPDELRRSASAGQLVRNLVDQGTPILLGSLDSEQIEEEGVFEFRYYNSAFLVKPGGILAGEYRKRHLVMFGEYIPFGKLLPFLRSLTPMPEDVSPGDKPGLMEMPLWDFKLGLLICFEDLIPGLARDLVTGGARLIVNQTNDAWFDPLWGSRGHLANAVFRSVEQRRPMVRATNSGVSAWIDEKGVVRARIEDPLNPGPGARYRVRGSTVFAVELPKHPETTFFHRHPRAFVLTCWVLSLLLAGKQKPSEQSKR